jgi:hypothetical protein
MNGLRPAARSSLSLAGAVDALARAARQGGRPGTIWIVGLFYQGLSLGWTFGFTVARPSSRGSRASRRPTSGRERARGGALRRSCKLGDRARA